MSSQTKWLVVIIFSILALFLNFIFIDDLIMPDPCYYHIREMNPVLKFFYTATAASGGHPEQNIFSLIFTILSGGLIGKFVNYIYEKVIKTE